MARRKDDPETLELIKLETMTEEEWNLYRHSQRIRIAQDRSYKDARRALAWQNAANRLLALIPPADLGKAEEILTEVRLRETELLRK